MPKPKSFKVMPSQIENGVEICNTCCREAAHPYRYKNSKGEERGCVATCHDKYITRNTHPNWCEPRMVLPKWVTTARNSIQNFERCVIK